MLDIFSKLTKHCCLIGSSTVVVHWQPSKLSFTMFNKHQCHRIGYRCNLSVVEGLPAFEQAQELCHGKWIIQFTVGALLCLPTITNLLIQGWLVLPSCRSFPMPTHRLSLHNLTQSAWGGCLWLTCIMHMPLCLPTCPMTSSSPQTGSILAMPLLFCHNQTQTTWDGCLWLVCITHVLPCLLTHLLTSSCL